MNVQTGTGNTLFHLMIFRKILVYLRNEILTDARNDTGGSFPTKIQLAICFLYIYKLKFIRFFNYKKTRRQVWLPPCEKLNCFNLYFARLLPVSTKTPHLSRLRRCKAPPVQKAAAKALSALMTTQNKKRHKNKAANELSLSRF